MYIKEVIIVFLLLVWGCKETTNSSSSLNAEDNMAAANEFLDAFYSFNSDKLESVLKDANKSKPSILYYQGWAEGGNYEIIERHPLIVQNDSLVICPVTVKDDLIGALELDFNVTDTFHITVINGRILSVNTSSNDPPLFHEARDWVSKNRPELIAIPCQGIWEGGSTPGECVQAMVKGYSEFMASRED